MQNLAHLIQSVCLFFPILNIKVFNRCWDMFVSSIIIIISIDLLLPPACLVCEVRISNIQAIGSLEFQHTCIVGEWELMLGNVVGSNKKALHLLQLPCFQSSNLSRHGCFLWIWCCIVGLKTSAKGRDYYFLLGGGLNSEDSEVSVCVFLFYSMSGISLNEYKFSDLCQMIVSVEETNINHLTHVTSDHYHIHHWPILHVFAIFSNNFYIVGGPEDPPKIIMTPPPRHQCLFPIWRHGNASQ